MLLLTDFFKLQESAVTVIRIGENSSNEVNLPYVLQDRGKGPTSGNWSSTPPKQPPSPNLSNVVVINADITPPQDDNAEEDQQKKVGTSEVRNVERLFKPKGKLKIEPFLRENDLKITSIF